MTLHRNPRFLAPALLLAGVAGLAFWLTHDSDAVGQPAKGKTADEEQAIRQAQANYIVAMNKGDLDAILAFWAADADYVDEAGKMTKGKDAIAALYRKVLPTLKDTKISGKIHSIKFLRPEVALADGSIDHAAADGTKDSNRYAVVWTKTDGKWLISSARDLPAEVIDLPSLAYAQLKPLEWLVGEWVDDDPKKDVSIRVTWDKNKTFLLANYTIKQDDGEPLEVSMRIGWDGLNGRVRSWVFDSNGGFGEGFWKKDGKKWIVGTSGVLPDGGSGGATNEYEFVDAKTFIWRSADREVDGQPLADAEVKFVRKASK